METRCPRIGAVLILFVLLIIGVSSEAQVLQVSSVKNDKADFTGDKRFYWAKQIEMLSDKGRFFYDDLFLKADMKRSVRDGLETLGYNFSSDQPDYLINFRLFREDATLRGGHGYGNEYWSGQEFDPSVDSSTFRIRAGTIIISIIDRKARQRVWQGFASGVDLDDEEKIKEAVQALIVEYSNRAYIYSRR